ncbi:hypothetical protein C8R45DRAFT_947123 [Mycena sanguinolenta]|nr:hypothetical protein C8R45DRAFT_947123 [Mycena sanguinolenta]
MVLHQARMGACWFTPDNKAASGNDAPEMKKCPRRTGLIGALLAAHGSFSVCVKLFGLVLDAKDFQGHKKDAKQIHSADHGENDTISAPWSARSSYWACRRLLRTENECGASTLAEMWRNMVASATQKFEDMKD